MVHSWATNCAATEAISDVKIGKNGHKHFSVVQGYLFMEID